MAKPVLGSDPLARLKARSPELLPHSTAPAETAAPPARGPASPPARRKKDDLDARIRAFERGLEKRLGRFEAGLSDALRPEAELDPTAERRLQEALARVEEKIGRLSTMVEELEEEEREGLLETVIALGDAVQRALSFDTYRRYFNNLGMRDHRYEVDDFGLESDARDALLPYVKFLFQRWWRVKVEGVENLPFEGPGLIIANHSGVLPYDGVMISYAVELIDISHGE